jgi:hypothetical protein
VTTDEVIMMTAITAMNIRDDPRPGFAEAHRRLVELHADLVRFAAETDPGGRIHDRD